MKLKPVVKWSAGAILLALVLAWLYYANLLQVISPRPGNITVFTRDPNTGQISLVVHFSQPVDPATAVVGKTVFMSFQTDSDAAATLKWSNQNRSLTITTVKSVDQLGAGFSLTLKGTRPPDIRKGRLVIRSAKGRVLDGNNDFLDGGDLVVHY
jgi:hypothetical protein